MSDDLIFMMGEFEAVFPTDRQFVKNHMWATKVTENRFRFGFTSYAVRLLQDVYFLDWAVDAPASIAGGQEIGSIESKKAESSLYSPASGELVLFNDALMEDPSAINTDKYGEGWLFEMDVSEPPFLAPEAYLHLLDDVWDKTQKTIKGQVQ